MAPARESPDEHLERVVEKEAHEKRGKLSVYFGAAPGVGKTHAMLEAAREERERARASPMEGRGVPGALQASEPPASGV